MSTDVTEVQCPYCFEWLEFYVDPGTQGEMIEDCEVCCRPWKVYVSRNGDDKVMIQVSRAQ